MAELTDRQFIDEIIMYKHTVISQIAMSQPVIALLCNQPNISMDSDEAYEAVEKYIFDYDYIDRSVVTSEAYIMVDSRMLRMSSGSMNQWELYVQVVCAKPYNHLDPKLFKGVVGNRRDNIAKQVDARLNGQRLMGIGTLDLYSVDPASVPDTFTSVLLTYRISDFRKERLEQNGRY